ncbi:hypothetical protein [Pontibacter vulgaris]|uniref:hypothetical protein n=1 Tax=Pontibacter vulgaris TaxID=2905679 RepID=UPI001FA6CBCC|nr:hypothetical protein [Pontibacter vulgaris]
MNKNVLAVFAAVCGLFMVSCSTPSDQRPEEKVSVDTVAPGTRNTNNIETEHAPMGHENEDEAMINHVQTGGVHAEENKANEADSVSKPGNTAPKADSVKH